MEDHHPVIRRQSIAEKLQSAMCRSGYTNAGTVEFLMDETGKFYFIEVNARVQVEHPVTKFVTGVDIVKSQILIAAGARLSETMETSVRLNGPHQRRESGDVCTVTGRITGLNLPGGIRIWVDTAAYTDGVVTPYYDSLVAKLITHGRDRAEAIQRMRRALDMFIAEGIHTSIPQHQHILAEADFQVGKIDT